MMALRLSVFLMTVATSAAVFASPASVLLIRHGEKPETEQDPHLGKRGFERAQALVPMFTQDARFLDHGLPVAIYAGSNKKSDGSLRPLETIEPTARALDLQVITEYTAKSYAEAAQEVLTSPHYEGRTVIMSWTRDELPGLAHELGLKKRDIPKWRSATYDRVWRIDYDDDGEVVSFNDLPQDVLPGDSRH